MDERQYAIASSPENQSALLDFVSAPWLMEALPHALKQCAITTGGFYFGGVFFGPIGALILGFSGVLVGFIASDDHISAKDEFKRLNPEQKKVRSS
jgi:hypothetical protein